MPASPEYSNPRLVEAPPYYPGVYLAYVPTPLVHPPPPFASFTLVHGVAFSTTALTLNCSTATSSTAVMAMLNKNGASNHPCRRNCLTSNQSKYSSLSVGMRAHISSWKWRTTASVVADTMNRANAVHKRVRSTKSYALARSSKHI